jgi:hypothetical protein
MRGFAFLALALAIAGPAMARTSYAAYDGPDAVQTGTGGTHTDMKGIDVWTSGSPSRKFQVLGVIVDERTDKLFDGDALSSPAIAKKAREAGGDALILLNRDSRVAGFMSSESAFGSASLNGNSISGGGFSERNGRVVNAKTTRFAVIKFLP